jgi:hypothetical protein
MAKALILAAFGCAVFAADLIGGETTTPETARIYYPFGGKQVGRWTFGALVGLEQPASVIYAFDKQAQQLGTFVIRTPGEASSIHLYRAVRAPDGGYAAGGIANLPSGAAAYVWRISADGLQQKAIPTSPYIAGDVAVAPDGMVWTAGVQKQTIRMSYEGYAEDWDIVHRYSADGRPAGSWLSSKSVKCTDGHWHGGATGLMLASANKVVWYPANANEYVEFSLEGKIAVRNPTAPVTARQRFSGAALCSGGGLFVGRETYGERGLPERFEVLGWDQATLSWRTVAGFPQSPRGWLYGCEADRLVTWSRTAADGATELDFWIPQASAK